MTSSPRGRRLLVAGRTSRRAEIDEVRKQEAAKAEEAAEQSATSRAARFGALLAVVGALIGVVSAGGASLITAAAARSQSQDDFIRNQRQTAYVNLITDLAEFQLALPTSPLILPRVALNGDTSLPASVRESYTRLTRDFDTALLIGSTVVQGSLTRLQRACDIAANSTRPESPTDPRSARLSNIIPLAEYANDIETAKQAFLADAKRELTG